MKPCISQATTMPSGFESDIEDYGQVGCQAVELWLTKLEDYLKDHQVSDVAALCAERGISCAAAAYQGGLLESTGARRDESFALFERRLELCSELKIPTLIIAADFQDDFSIERYRAALETLTQAGSAAAAAGVRLAVEFLGHSQFCNNLETAVVMTGESAQSNVGVCLDVFHYYKGPSKLEDLRLLTRENLFHVQLCDLSGVPRELARDADRILPGDGDFHLEPILDVIRSIGYDRYVSVELMNPRLWQLPAAQVAEVSVTALRKLLGLSSNL